MFLNRNERVAPRGWLASQAPALAIALCAMFGSGPAQAGEVVEVEGVAHVRNGATPSGGVETIELEELWRAGGDDDDVIFGLISRVLVDDDGTVYLLDTQLSEVKVFSPDGELVKTLSREGDGPGETRSPTDMAFMPDGTIGLAQMFPGRITKIDREGNPSGVIQVGGDPASGGFSILRDLECAGGNMVLCPTKVSQGERQATQIRTDQLASYNEDGTEKVSYLEKEHFWDFTDFTLDEGDQYFVYFGRFAVGPTGQVVAAPERNSYALNVYDPAGDLLRVIEREYEPWKRNAEDMVRVEGAFAGAMRQFPFEIKTKIYETEPDINSLNFTDDGELWVVPSRGVREQPDGVMQTFDVFDTEGHFIKQVSVACEGNGEDDALIAAGDDRFILVKGFVEALLMLQGGGAGEGEEEEEEESAPMEVICYSIRS